MQWKAYQSVIAATEKWKREMEQKLKKRRNWKVLHIVMKKWTREIINLIKNVIEFTSTSQNMVYLPNWSAFIGPDKIFWDKILSWWCLCRKFWFIKMIICNWWNSNNWSKLFGCNQLKCQPRLAGFHCAQICFFFLSRRCFVKPSVCPAKMDDVQKIFLGFVLGCTCKSQIC